MTVYCMKCGAELDEGAKFCNVCGARVNRASGSSYRDANGLSGDTAPNMAPLPPSMPQDYIRYDGAHERTGTGKVIAIVCAVALVAALAAGGTWFALNSASSGSSNPVLPDGIATVPGGVDEVSTASGKEGDDSSAIDEAGQQSGLDDSDDISTGDEAPSPGPGAEGFILPDSDTHLYSTSELEGLSDWELSIARNEIYARHGRTFQNEDLQGYFEAQDWYTPLYDPEEFDDEVELSSTEIANAETIRALENAE